MHFVRPARLAALAGLLCASTLSAQMLFADADPNAPAPQASGSVFDALGDPVEAFDLTAATTNNRCLGIEHAFGYYWVSGSLAAAADQQFIYQFDEDWNLVNTFPQVTNSPSPAFWGHRDGASDESTNRLYFGQEGGEFTTYEYDDSTGMLTHVSTDVYPVLGVIRALARNPNNGHFFTKNFGGSIIEFDEDGTFINEFFDTASTYGMAWDSLNDTLWLHATGGTGPFGHYVFEIDPTTGIATGRQFNADEISPPGTTASIVGGFTIVGDSELFVVLGQGTPNDFAGVYEGENFSGVCYADCDDSGGLDFFDFLCFQNAFAAMEPYADCDMSGGHDFFDFLCFQNEFAAGCP